jgi:hypothetical protein
MVAGKSLYITVGFGSRVRASYAWGLLDLILTGLLLLQPLRTDATRHAAPTKGIFIYCGAFVFGRCLRRGVVPNVIHFF